MFAKNQRTISLWTRSTECTTFSLNAQNTSRSNTLLCNGVIVANSWINQYSGSDSWLVRMFVALFRCLSATSACVCAPVYVCVCVRLRLWGFKTFHTIDLHHEKRHQTQNTISKSREKYHFNHKQRWACCACGGGDAMAVYFRSKWWRRNARSEWHVDWC